MKINRSKGFTIVEVVIVMLILGILVAGSSSLLLQGFRSYFAGKDIINADWQASLALERMVDDVRNIRSSADISTATSSQLTFVDADGTSISYSVTSSQLRRNTQGLADNIASLSLTYYDANGAVTATISAIRYIVITLNVVYNNLTFSITTAVQPWSLS